MRYLLSKRVGAVISIAVALGIGEVCLRYTGSVASHFEKNGIPNMEACYSETFTDPWILVREPNSRRIYNRKDFHQENWAFANGLIDPEFEKKKDPSEIRIIFIGDSFVESIGDTEFGSVVYRIRSILNSKKSLRRYSVLNAGIGGSDPVFGLQLLQRKLLDYSPDIVVMSGNGSDVLDLQRRGGLDRFTPEGYLKTQYLPFWTPLFNHFHLFRAFALGILRYDWFCRPPSEQRKYEVESVIQEIVKTVKAASELSKQKRVNFLYLTNPNEFDLEQREKNSTLSAIIRRLKSENVPSEDLAEEFFSRIPKSDTKSYYWPTDHHYTPKGYQVFADSIISVMKKRGLIE